MHDGVHVHAHMRICMHACVHVWVYDLVGPSELAELAHLDASGHALRLIACERCSIKPLHISRIFPLDLPLEDAAGQLVCLG